jgi:NitT/TauT family transport system ATP-binding protein
MPDVAIEMRGVEKRFEGRTTVHALTAIDLEIRDSEFAVLLGPSGCGKSTLLNVVAGFEQPSSGLVNVFGARITAPAPDRAVVFQEAALFPWLTVWENVAFAPKIKGLRYSEYEPLARAYLEQVGLGNFHDALPDQLSGGMKQRVGIARALVMEPRVFLMDEPFGALDAQTRLTMQELLLNVWERHKKTVLFITHDIDEAILLADTLYVMSARPGRIKARIPVDLPRPRGVDLLTSDEFNALRKKILQLIRDEAEQAVH